MRARPRAAASRATERAPSKRWFARRAAGVATASLSRAAAARLLRRAARLRPFGYARIARAPFASAPAEVAREALARVVVCVGGRIYAPRARRLERALATLADAAPFTLGGCRVAPCGGDALVAREAVPLPDLPLEPGGPPVRWDGRFELSASADAGRGPFFVRRLDNESWSALRRRAAPAPLPPLLRPGLPALFDLDGSAAYPTSPPETVGRRRSRPRSALSAR